MRLKQKFLKEFDIPADVFTDYELNDREEPKEITAEHYLALLALLQDKPFQEFKSRILKDCIDYIVSHDAADLPRITKFKKAVKKLFCLK